MTDEQIEKALYDADDIAINDDVVCCDALDYINRLKANLESAIQCFTRMETLYKVKCNELKVAEDRVRKETAKEILRTLYNHANQGTKDVDNSFIFACNQMKTKILAEAKKHCVKVDE